MESRFGIYSEIDKLVLAAPSIYPIDNSTIKIPAKNIIEIKALWQCLIDKSRNLQITWSDKSVDAFNNFLWYGPMNPKGDANIESWYGGTYRALWTNHNQENWPKMIRFQFKHENNIIEIIVNLL